MKLLMQSAQRVPALLNKKKIMSQNQNPTFNFQISLEEANYILAGLQELPGKICNPLSEKIKAQAQEQITALQAATADASTETEAA
jgi:hypothetical protein